MRHFLLTYPYDREAVKQDYEFMLGKNILVAPVVEESTSGREVYLPRGDDWYFLNGDKLQYHEEDGRFTLNSNDIVKGG